MNWQIVITDTAKSDLRDIALAIYEKSRDIDTALHFVDELEQKCLDLQNFPERGAIPKDYFLKAMGYRYSVYKHYLILYTTDTDISKVFIHAVFHEKLDYFRYVHKRLI